MHTTNKSVTIFDLQFRRFNFYHWWVLTIIWELTSCMHLYTPESNMGQYWSPAFINGAVGNLVEFIHELHLSWYSKKTPRERNSVVSITWCDLSGFFIDSRCIPIDRFLWNDRRFSSSLETSTGCFSNSNRFICNYFAASSPHPLQRKLQVTNKGHHNVHVIQKVWYVCTTAAAAAAVIVEVEVEEVT